MTCWRLVYQVPEWKTPEGPSNKEASRLFWVLPPGPLLGFHRKYQRKNPACFWQGERKKNCFEICQSILLLNKATLFYQSLICRLYQHPICLGEGKEPAPTNHPVPPRGRKSLRVLVKFPLHGHGLTGRERTSYNHGTAQSSKHHNTENLFLATVLLGSDIMSSCQQKITRTLKSKKRKSSVERD